MGLKLPSASSSGCSTKIRAGSLSTLLQLQGKEFFQTLARDAGRLSKSRASYFTVDTISPITRNPEIFGRISVNHAITDLHSLGAIPTDACVSFGLDSNSSNNPDGISLIASVKQFLEEKGIAFCKAHSYLCEEVHVTLAIIGKNNRPLPGIETGKEYALILTKELGASTACHNGSLQGKSDVVKECETLMLLDHTKILTHIRKFCFSGTTDISGFGFLGHLVILSQSEACEMQVNLSNIPYFERLDDVVSSYPVNCSAQRNEEDFEEFCQWKKEVSAYERKKLFSSETSGPILCIVSKNSSSKFIQLINSDGFRRATNVGILRKTNRPSFQLV